MRLALRPPRREQWANAAFAHKTVAEIYIYTKFGASKPDSSLSLRRASIYGERCATVWCTILEAACGACGANTGGVRSDQGAKRQRAWPNSRRLAAGTVIARRTTSALDPALLRMDVVRSRTATTVTLRSHSKTSRDVRRIFGLSLTPGEGSYARWTKRVPDTADNVVQRCLRRRDEARWHVGFIPRSGEAICLYPRRRRSYGHDSIDRYSDARFVQFRARKADSRRAEKTGRRANWSRRPSWPSGARVLLPLPPARLFRGTIATHLRLHRRRR